MSVFKYKVNPNTIHMIVSVETIKKAEITEAASSKSSNVSNPATNCRLADILSKVKNNENATELGKNISPLFLETERFSLNVDSEGKELSEGQRKNFADSKVVDAEGRLIPMYHGSNYKFTVFDPKKLGAHSGNKLAGRMIVNHYKDGYFKMDLDNVVYAMTTKKEEVASLDAHLRKKLEGTPPKLSITQLLYAVKRTFPGDFSKDVTSHGPFFVQDSEMKTTDDRSEA